MEEELYQIVYVSTANPQLTEDALLELLSASQKRNAERAISGLLLHSDGNIIQVIEGPRRHVRELYAKIAIDRRHRRVTTMASRSIKTRDFPQYKMGFKRARSKHFKEELPGFTDIVETRGVTEEKIQGLSKMVAVFIRTFARSAKIDRFGPEAG